MPSSSVLRRARSLAALAVFPVVARASSVYTVQSSWEGQNILNHFNFFDREDPTNGFVTYVNQSYAENAGLVKITDSGSLYMGVDYDSVLAPDGPGRESVRIESNEYYDQGLYVVDIKHMPGSICGTWPAFWTVGPNWPYDGEIDIIEGVNRHEANKIVLHTSGSCDVGGGHEMAGELTSSECGEASGTIGCVVEGQHGSSGTPFNQQGGGVYAMEWQREYVKIWFFPRSSIPASLTAGKPDTSTFGTPMAHLQGGCDFQERFTHQKLILDTTFCGDWAGNVYGDSGCPVSDPSNPMQSCINYVAQNPAAFKEAYWELNSVKIFKQGAPPAVTADSPPEPAPSNTQTEAETETRTTATATTTHTTTDKPVETATEEPTTETVPPVTSTSTHTRTETLPSTTSTVEHPAIEPITTAPSAPSDVDPVDTAPAETAPVTKSTSFVTVTTTLCPVSSVQTAAVSKTTSFVTRTTTFCPSSNAEIPAPPPSSTSESVVEAPAPPETVPTSQPVAPSLPPDSTIYTAPASWSSTGLVIASSSSPSITLPTAVSPSSTDEPEADQPELTPSVVETPTSPSNPVFTGMGSKLSISGSVIFGALALMLLA
ncbi:concanavalin A-like lectin/glucanase domain-containing protein [Aspergillus egyptiacus]|nr:concanavalin A-like lectin/glucanase domain-containing protein [Aspergillus egyptiacus]